MVLLPILFDQVFFN